jgi:hypothetical protein
MKSFLFFLLGVVSGAGGLAIIVLIIDYETRYKRLRLIERIVPPDAPPDYQSRVCRHVEKSPWN